ncbi:hypothetical protein [Nonomuraea sp. B5E05]|uniref:hypothetical protein n=1 Tax=Nonomuraea sp. B5E05 TaxID=3153569 RepID=UPI0032600464
MTNRDARPETGYSVRSESLRLQSQVFTAQRESLAKARDDLRAAFDRDRNTLGNDEYGAELAKKLPEMERNIFTALKGCIDEFDGLAGGLHTNAGNYEAADRPRTGNP